MKDLLKLLWEKKWEADEEYTKNANRYSEGKSDAFLFCINEIQHPKCKADIKVLVNGRVGYTTSVVAHSGGIYPVWFDGGVEFVNAKDVTF